MRPVGVPYSSFRLITAQSLNTNNNDKGHRMYLIPCLIILLTLIILWIVVASFTNRESNHSSLDSSSISAANFNPMSERSNIHENMPTYITLLDICNATYRCSYNLENLRILTNYLEDNFKRGLDTVLSSDCNEALINDGIIIISSPEQIGRDIVLAKLNAGKGLLGGQKAAYGLYLGQLEHNEFIAGTTYKSFAVALSSINNIYRSIGLL